jgi:SAM-dependent methyltransferase
MEIGLYAESYYDMRRKTERQRFIAYQQESKRVIQRADGRRILDYGCGDGSFLEWFTDWEWYGVEISEYCIRQCTAKEIRMVNTASLIDGSLDVVVFRGVLQHLDNPFNALREAERLLRDGGLLAVLAQPDADSLCYRMFGELPALDPPRNWWIPGRRELINVMARLGFSEFEVLHPYWGGPYARPLRDFARFALRMFGIRKPFAFPGNMIELYARKGS